MSKSVKKTSIHEKDVVLSALYESAKQFDGRYPAVNFIDELLTESEKLTIGRRILIAQMILSGCYQTEIRSKLDVSPNTFTRTRKWLEGQIPQYADALKEYETRNATKKSRAKNGNIPERFDPLTFRGIRKKYPMHFLFFNLAEALLKKINT